MVLDMFSKDRRKALAEYSRFMDDDGFESSEIFEDMEVIGDTDSLGMKEILIKNTREPMDDILKFVAVNEDDFRQIKKSSRSRKLTNLKKRYIEECLKRNYRMEEIGKNIGISQAAVSKLLN